MKDRYFSRNKSKTNILFSASSRDKIRIIFERKICFFYGYEPFVFLHNFCIGFSFSPLVTIFSLDYNLSFQFPFTVSRVDFGGILVFISEHFANHADSSLGSFAASNVRITHGDSKLTDGYMLSVDLTLAPFDLGVAEELSMYSAPSDIDGVDVVTVNILRKDGSMGAWLRGNRRFVDEIRNQFLLWRSLPVETVMHYRQLAAESLKGEAAEGERA